MKLNVIEPGSSPEAFHAGRFRNAVADNTSEAFSKAMLALREIPDWVRVLSERLDSFLDLPSNWDSYGAAPPLPDAIERGKQVLGYIGQIVGIEPPAIAISPAGNVAFSWEFNDGRRNLEVEIQANGIIHYAYLNEDNDSDDREGSTSNLDALLGFLTQW